MSEPQDKSLDILGVKPVANSIEKITDGVVDGAAAFLSKICLPAAEEFGYFLQDHVVSWRSSRAKKLAGKAEKKVIQQYGNAHVTISPRIAHIILEEGSWIDDEEVHNMWAGLLASSCSEAGHDDSNIVFISILKQLTTLQVRIMSYAVKQCNKFQSDSGLPFTENFTISVEDLFRVAGSNDVIRLDREMDHLVALSLIRSPYTGGGGFAINSDQVDITPSSLALNLYIRGDGFPGTPAEYWSLEKKNP